MTIQLQIAALKEYLAAKVAAEDWHGVSDAANDLRVLEAKVELKCPSCKGPFGGGNCEYCQ